MRSPDISPWAWQALSAEALALAYKLHLTVIGGSPKGPWVVRGEGLAKELRGGDADALVLRAAKELTNG